ncbi:hypothetical protein PQU92_09940 [Asticcacaulis sp. BYS171W]|uniref:Porin n=1 Tax=Asticcacaulis aquaticus TaxID=2984212 RepID=A0ABT5HU53_9CAUL|nr:outer membrane beta-barrel protein [Asticcacaulis aquaticus]MDC7683598.1 hypothetical protein [Asticcacaulis aquaticus]
MKYLIALLGLLATPAFADTSLFARENIKGWIDLRAVSANGEKSWLDGHYGKLRYGDQSKLSLGEATLIWTPRFTDTLSAYVQVVHVPEWGHETGINEAYLKWRPVPKSGLRVSARLGQMYPPVSLEHEGTGWTTTHTITPSAINAWVGEEVIVQGAELSLKQTFDDQQIGVTLGVFRGNDTSGTLLAYRGWALHDLRSTTTAKPPLPVGNAGWSQTFRRQSPFTKPLKEVDDRQGYYLRLDWRPPVPVSLNFTYFNTHGNPTDFDNGQYGWATRFFNFGAKYEVTETTDILSQVMVGNTKWGRMRTDGVRAIDADYRSAYVMVSHRFDDGARLSLRGETFETEDYSAPSLDNNNETGHAVTLAWMRPVNAHLDLNTEVLHIDSDRPARAYQGLPPQQDQTQVQVMLKVKF